MRAQALLRRHRFPGDKKIATFEAFMKKIGYPIKVEKDTRIQEEINKVLANETIKMATKEIIKHEMVYLLEMAEYFVVGESDEKEWLHYALNMPVYTHFTSPIRRYPDIIVHRQLISVIEAKKNNQ
jgi:exoribonuclease R